MIIQLNEVTIKDLTQGYSNNAEEGVIGYSGNLNIRPAYQREFVYKDKQRDAVIETIRKNFPLNVLYWVKNEDGSFEVLDGQQRTISICEYVTGGFSLNHQFFHNLEQEEKEQILNYKLMVYFCEGENREKLDWFETINIAGEKLTDQELRNAIYTGAWLTDAKKYFSRTKCPAQDIGEDYIKGAPIRQEYLEKVISWISEGEINNYMAKSQHKPNANELWLYFQNLISWVKVTFPVYRREMKGLDWGSLYNTYKDNEYDSKEMEARVSKLMQDEEVTKKAGIYEYILSGKEKNLNLRSFTPQQKREAYERQNGICPVTQKHFEFEEMEADHIIPWSRGGKTSSDNCQMLSKEANREKSDR
jgi:hypothetical protein